MATLTWQEVHPLEGQYELDWQAGGSASFRRTWIVRSDVPVTEQAVLNDTGAPQIGQAHPRYEGAYCTRVHAAPQGPLVWQVEAEYQTPGRTGQQNPNPLNRPARIRWSTVVMRMPVFYDRDGKPILNTAGEPFDPPLEVDRKLPVVEVRKNLASVPSWILDYREAINSTAWTIDGVIILAKCAMMESVEVSEVQVENDISYREVAYRAVVAPTALGWQPRLLNAGYSELVGSGNNQKLAPIVINGTTPSHPVPLDANGRRIPKPTPTNVIWLTFNVYPELDFNFLPR